MWKLMKASGSIQSYRKINNTNELLEERIFKENQQTKKLHQANFHNRARSITWHSNFYLLKTLFSFAARSSSCVICSGRAEQVTERGVSPEGNRGSRLTGGSKIPTVTPTGYWHWAADTSLNITPTVRLFASTLTFRFPLTRAVHIQQMIRTESIPGELEITQRKSVVRTGAGRTVPPSGDEELCACVLVLLLFIDWDRRGVSGFKVKEDSKQWSWPTQGQITRGCQTGQLAEWN